MRDVHVTIPPIVRWLLIATAFSVMFGSWLPWRIWSFGSHFSLDHGGDSWWQITLACGLSALTIVGWSWRFEMRRSTFAFVVVLPFLVALAISVIRWRAISNTPPSASTDYTAGAFIGVQLVAFSGVAGAVVVLAWMAWRGLGKLVLGDE